MSKKKQKNRLTPEQEVRKQEEVFDSLPRTITPIGIFFGHGATRDESGQQPSPLRRRQRRKRSPIGTPAQRNVIALVAAILFAIMWFLVSLPALNVRDTHFWVMLLAAALVFIALRTFLDGTPERKPSGESGFFRALYRSFGPSIAVVGVLVLVLLAGNLSSWVFVRPGAYAKLVDVPEAPFAEAVSPVTPRAMPALDVAAAQQLAQEALSQRSDLVVDYMLSSKGAQIVYKGELVHVFPLEFASARKNFSGIASGIPACILVRDATRDVEVVDIEGGLKYGANNYFAGDVNRHLRLAYPATIFRDTHLELDENGHPFWVASVIAKTVGAFGGDEVAGVILVDAVSGEGQILDLAEVPSWVDAVYSAGLLATQYNNYGIYHNGILNALTDKEDVTSIANGYGTMAQGEDLYVCAGVSAVSNVRTTIGYLYANQRTKETVFVRIEGRDEVAVQTAALEEAGPQDSVSAYPVLANVGGRPVYCLCLMDQDYAFKRVALVPLDEEGAVVLGESIADCLAAFEN